MQSRQNEIQFGGLREGVMDGYVQGNRISAAMFPHRGTHGRIAAVRYSKRSLRDHSLAWLVKIVRGLVYQIAPGYLGTIVIKHEQT